MNSLLLITVVLTLSLQNITKKEFNNKLLGKGTIAFSAAATLVAAILFVIRLKIPFDYSPSVLAYSVMFGLGYGASTLFSILAIYCGSLSFTSLITSYSLIVPTIYGLVFLKEKISTFLIIGLALLVVSLFLINYVKGKEQKQIKIKWIIYVVIAFLGNGLCTTVQKVQIIDFNGKYKNEFMTVALLLVAVSLFIVSFFKEKNEIAKSIKSGIVPILICGLANGISNIVVMALSLRMSASVMFPLISAGSVVVTFFISVLWYKEKMTLTQKIGFALGVSSVVFLNI